jgi:hypothetical protein
MTDITNRDIEPIRQALRDNELIWQALGLVIAASETGAIELDPQDRQDMERLLDAMGNQDCMWKLVPNEGNPNHPDFVPKIGVVK